MCRCIVFNTTQCVFVCVVLVNLEASPTQLSGCSCCTALHCTALHCSTSRCSWLPASQKQLWGENSRSALTAACNIKSNQIKVRVSGQPILNFVGVEPLSDTKRAKKVCILCADKLEFTLSLCLSSPCPSPSITLFHVATLSLRQRIGASRVG